MTEPTALAQLRHLYQNMVNGAVRDTASAKRIAEGLLAPAIEALERGTPPAVAGEPVAWMGTHDKTDLYYRKPPQADVVPLYATPQPTNPAPAAQGDASWPRLRSALAMAMLGWGYRQDQDRTIETCYTVLDAITEPGMPLALLRTAPDWRYAARSQDKQGGAHHD